MNCLVWKILQWTGCERRNIPDHRNNTVLALRGYILRLLFVLVLCGGGGIQAADYPVQIQGTLPEQEGGEIGNTTVTTTELTADLGSPEISVQGRFGVAFFAPNGQASLSSASMLCITSTQTSIVNDASCEGGVLVNLPPAGVVYSQDALLLSRSGMSFLPSGRSGSVAGYTTNLGEGSYRGPDYLSAGVYYTYSAAGEEFYHHTPGSVSGTVRAYAGHGLKSGKYAGQVTARELYGTNTHTFSYNIIVDGPPPSCSVDPVPPVEFGHLDITTGYDGLLSQQAVQVTARCTVRNNNDIGKSVYLTFAAGSYGLYESNNKKLATSLSGLYITGGVDKSDCNDSQMIFDGMAHPDFKLMNITAAEIGIVSVNKKNLLFSLCRDKSKPLQAGSMASNAVINAIVQ